MLEMNRHSGTYLLWIGLTLLCWMAPGSGWSDMARFKETVREFAALEDRSTGTPGNTAAAELIRSRFSGLGFKTVGAQNFSTAVRQLHFDEENMEL